MIYLYLFIVVGMVMDGLLDLDGGLLFYGNVSNENKIKVEWCLYFANLYGSI